MMRTLRVSDIVLPVGSNTNVPLAAGDLAGLKVSHDFEELDEGDDRILTLKDSRILDNEGLSCLLSNSSHSNCTP